MTCKGILPDGTQCDAEDRHTNPATGPCGSCGSPQGTALVPVGDNTDLMADLEVAALYETLPPKAQAFLEAYVEATTIFGAAKAAGISKTSHYNWLKNLPGYPEVFEVAQLEVRDRLRHHFTNKAMNGLRERMYDADGNLKHTRIREDAALLKMLMMAVDPEMYNPYKNKHEGVTIILHHEYEGWDPGESASDRLENLQEAKRLGADYADEGEHDSHSAETEVIEVVEVEAEEPRDEARVEHRSDGLSGTWRQRQAYTELLSALPDDDEGFGY